MTVGYQLCLRLTVFFIVEVTSLIGKAKIKTIKVTGVLILGFILTWFPYQVNCLW